MPSWKEDADITCSIKCHGVNAFVTRSNAGLHVCSCILLYLQLLPLRDRHGRLPVGVSIDYSASGHSIGAAPVHGLRTEVVLPSVLIKRS